ncbi:MAG: response regulator [Candidatus Omnitrophica bacterium]|nr:response regulator [Candidatus Omnitrophota bacterium]
MAKILVIDSEREARNFTCRFFSERHFDVAWAGDVLEALPIVKDGHPDIVVLCINTDAPWDIEALKSIKEANPQTRIIIISSDDDIDIMQKALQSGAVAFLSKPILLSELIDIVLRNLKKNRRYFEMKIEPKNE